MKKTLLLCVIVCISMFSGAQAVLNEVYPQPGNGYHEFFELYNQNDSVENLDNYTLVVYYEEGSKSGFYVLDFPNYNLAAHDYVVGASQISYDIQGQTGQTADFNWNSMPAGGSITKWERNGSSYTSVPVPANLNDLFVRIVGPGGVFHIFLYKNGLIVNGLIAGSNSSSIPSYIESMPNLPINMSGTSPDFTINFNSVPDDAVEYLSNSAGTNNGYYRGSDGVCGEWLKSDQPGQHNPSLTNGNNSSGSANQVGVSAIVSQYAMDPTKALLTYNIVSAPAAAFPMTVEVYTDLGIAGQWDINDILLDTRVIASSAAGAQNIILPTWDVAVIIVVKSPSDCYSRILPVGNYWSVLPVRLTSFQGNINQNNKALLQWTVENNNEVYQFEVQRSFDGKEFKTIGLVFSSEKINKEEYMFYETIGSYERVMYRLKMTDKKNDVSYSKILVFQGKSTTVSTMKVHGNPVSDQLVFSYTDLKNGPVNIKIYDMAGKVVMSDKINSREGHNIVNFPLASNLTPNMYVVELHNGTDTHKTKFIKQ